MKRNIYCKLSAFVMLLATSAGCSNFLEEDIYSAIPSDGYFADERAAELVINGVYGTLADKTNWGTYDVNLLNVNVGSFGYCSEYSDENMMELLNYSTTTSNVIVEQIYLNSYNSIEQANFAIDGISAMSYAETGISESMRCRLIAEAKFIRALNYFNLVRLFGGVPLVKRATTDMDDRYVPRSSVEAVYSLIIEDLEYASESLYYKATASVSPRYDVSDTGRATRPAALSLLAKVYLTAASMLKHSDIHGSWNTLQDGINSYKWVDMGECYTLAADYALQVISLSESSQIDVSLKSDYGYLFTPSGENSAESLFEVQFKDESNYGGRVGNWVNLLGLRNVYARRVAPTPELFDLYAKSYKTEAASGLVGLDTLNTDPRLLWNLPAYKILNEKKARVTAWRDVTFFKYRVGDDIINNNNSGVNFMVLRYADVLLTYAEALNELGRTEEALPYINQVRERARKGIGSTEGMGTNWALEIGESAQPADLMQGMSQQETLEAIIKERRMEFAAEGHSRFDDLRFGEYMSYAESRLDWTTVNLTTGATAAYNFFNLLALNDSTPSKAASAAANAKPYQQLLPIPKRETDINPALIQNPSWN